MTAFTFTATDINRNHTWEFVSNFASRDEAAAYAVKLHRAYARTGHVVHVALVA